VSRLLVATALVLAGLPACGGPEDCDARQARFDRASADAQEAIARWDASIGNTDLDTAKRYQAEAERAMDEVDEALDATRECE
jgi:hypothetical protein